jgi:hypothetical protein
MLNKEHIKYALLVVKETETNFYTLGKKKIYKNKKKKMWEGFIL